ncbi:uncharacterized protein A4U43_C07F2210 [Asparagus officinalis]|uniref:Uncharacterized protein n=1 Tax=Asparagus officinalis TaxID=4686 RepID=A0A5P1E961_ASPOF|nr:uncharacterized protein A4U43_C07F2210 [Asparagus officinalis]
MSVDLRRRRRRRRRMVNVMAKIVKKEKEHGDDYVTFSGSSLRSIRYWTWERRRIIGLDSEYQLLEKYQVLDLGKEADYWT